MVACPQCGGESPLPSGTRLVECPYCDASLFVDRSGLVSHYRVPRLLDAGQAEAALRRWMGGNTTVKHLDRDARLQRLTPVSFPVWMFRVRRPDGEVVRVQPAAPTTEPGLADLQVPAGRLEPYRPPEEGEVGHRGTSETPSAVAATVPVPVEGIEARVPLETALEWLGQREGGAPEVSETALVHLPLWRAEYGYQGEGYAALVDGSTGAVLASRFPAKSEGPFWLVAVAGLSVFVAEGLLLSHPLLKAVAFGITAVPLFLLAFWVARKV